MLVELPSDAPRGRVRLILKLVEDDLELANEDLHGLGLTAEEIAGSPEIGAWADCEITDGASYVEELRRSSVRYQW